MTISVLKAFDEFRKARWNGLLPEDVLDHADTSAWRPHRRHKFETDAERIKAQDVDEFASWLFQLRRDLLTDGTLTTVPAFPIYVRDGDNNRRELKAKEAEEALGAWQFTGSDFLAEPLGFEWEGLSGTSIEVDEVEFEGWLRRYRRTAEAFEIYQTAADAAALDLLMDLVREGSCDLRTVNEVRGTWGFTPLPAEAIRYDPMKVESWSLPMIQAWILSRSPHEVMVHSTTYRELVGLRALASFWGEECIAQVKEQAEKDVGGLEFQAFDIGESRRYPLDRRDWEELRFLSSPDDTVDLWGYTDSHVTFKALYASREDVLTCWPPDTAGARGKKVQPYKTTGTPGRPTSKTLFIAEFRRRAAGGELLPRLAQEAQHLADWINGQPDWPNVTSKTVENAIRDEYRAARTEQKDP